MSWLEEWRKAVGEEYADAEMTRCADRGTSMHALIEQYLQNQEPDVANAHPDGLRLFRQIRPYLNKINNVYALEKMLYNDKIGVIGRVDCVADYEGVPSVIDFKTSNRYKSRSDIENYFIQATFYAIAFGDMFEEGIEDIVIMIAVDKDGLPLIFKDKINKYVKPLLKMVKDFRRKNEWIMETIR